MCDAGHRRCSWKECNKRVPKSRPSSRFCSDLCYMREWRHNYKRNNGVNYTAEWMRDKRRGED